MRTNVIFLITIGDQHFTIYAFFIHKFNYYLFIYLFTNMVQYTNNKNYGVNLYLYK